MGAQERRGKGGQNMKKQENGVIFRCLKRALAQLLSERRPAVWFTLLLALGLFSFFLRAVILGTEAFTEIFHKGATTPFADFFQSVQDAALGHAAYSERRVIYPPLANALLFLLARVMPEAYLTAPAAHFGAHPAAILAFCVFFTLSFSLLALLLAREPHGGLCLPFAFFTAASFPVLFLLERGNLAILSLAALLLFVQGYYSESTKGREVGLFALGVAVALKVYPIVFALPLARERRFGALFRVTCYSFFLFLIPSLFFGGPLFCAGMLVKNTLYYSGYAGRGALAQLAALGLSGALSRLVIYGAYTLLLLLLLFCTLSGDKPYKTWGLSAAVLMCIPSIFSAYNWVLFLPALLSLFRTERLGGRSTLWFFLMAAPFFVFVPKPLQDNALIALIAAIIVLSAFEATARVFWARDGAKKQGS